MFCKIAVFRRAQLFLVWKEMPRGVVLEAVQEALLEKGLASEAVRKAMPQSVQAAERLLRRGSAK